MIDLFAGTTAEVRDYQGRICNKAIQMIDGVWQKPDGSVPDPARSVLIDSPTGSGKTVMALGLAQYGASLGIRIGLCAMRKNLLVQAEQMKNHFGFNVPNMRFISMFDRDPPTDVDWLIVDEAQHDSTSSMAHIHGRIQPKKVIGLSATPYRSDRAQLAFERIIRDIGIHSLIQEGYLSKFAHYTLLKYTPESVAEAFVLEPEKWGQSVIFFHQMEECRKLAELLTQAGITNEVVWGGSDKETQLQAFRDKKVQVLVSMSILTEGFDCDEMKTVFIRPSSKLPAVQMGGRVLRKNAELSLKQIVQCRNTHHPFIKTARPEISYIQIGTQWRSLQANKDVEATALIYQNKVLHAQCKMPSFISENKRLKIRTIIT